MALTKTDIENKVIEIVSELSYIDLTKEEISNTASLIWNKVNINDITFFQIPLNHSIASYNIEDKKVVRAINKFLNTNASVIRASGRTNAEFKEIKNQWLESLFEIVKNDAPLAVFNMLLNFDNMIKEEKSEEYDIFSSKLFDSILSNEKIFEEFEESLFANGIISEEKGKEYYISLREKFPNVYLYWLSIFFSFKPEYLTIQLIKRLIEYTNKNGNDISYFFELFTEVYSELPEEVEELTEDELDIIL